jgi:hypothetical protein
VDGDRDEFSDYDYRDYDLYAYPDDDEGMEGRHVGNDTSAEDMLPLAVSFCLLYIRPIFAPGLPDFSCCTIPKLEKCTQ